MRAETTQPPVADKIINKNITTITKQDLFINVDFLTVSKKIICLVRFIFRWPEQDILWFQSNGIPQNTYDNKNKVNSPNFTQQYISTSQKTFLKFINLKTLCLIR